MIVPTFSRHNDILVHQKATTQKQTTQLADNPMIK